MVLGGGVMSTLEKLERLRGSVYTVSLEFNDNRTNGDTVSAYLADIAANCGSGAVELVGPVPDDGSLIELIVYPRTSVGNCMWAGSDLDSLLTAALDYFFGERWKS